MYSLYTILVPPAFSELLEGQAYLQFVMVES